VWLTVLLLFVAVPLFAQPANDNCSNAQTINVTNGGFGLGTFTSSTNDLSNATLQSGETFAPAILVAGQNKKSMWYKFTLPTTRAVRVTLAQPGTTIKAGDAGFAVYKSNICLPSNANISTKLTPIGTFGNTYHPCVDSGVYYIQVSGNNNANGLLYIDVNISDTTGALYDHPAQAYNFGVVSPNSKYVDYTIGCQSIEDASEVCTVLQNATQYHKSSWHTFTTPAYFDYLSVILSNATSSYFENWNIYKKFGYTLYKGNAVTTPIASLVSVGGCDSIETNGYYAAYKMYKCGDLEPNTTYSIQLFAHETFNSDVRLGVYTGGLAPTQSPLPVLTASNNFGTLASSNSGTSKSLTDFLGCNSRHGASSCSPALPANGFIFNNKKYNLSTFFTFTLNTTANVDFYTYPVSPTYCGPAPVFRLFKQGLTANCSDLNMANLMGTYTYSSAVDCLLPGTYTVQVSGTDTTIPATSFSYATALYNSAECLSSNLGTKIQLVLTARTRMGFNKFSLDKPGAYDTINRVGNAMAPLISGNVYQMKIDTFGCINTVLPPDTTCGVGNNKVMYRQFVVADSGIASFSALDWYYQYKLYKGDANVLATSQNAHTHPTVINGLVAQTQCLNYTYSCTPKNVCVTPGTYTFASFGSDADIGGTDRPSVGFNVANTKHHNSALAQDMGSILDSVPAGGGSRVSDIDSFSCRDNAVPINGYTPCKINNIDATKAIYRQFYLKESALVSIISNNACGFATGTRTLFSGKATDGLSGLIPMGGRWNCFNSTTYSACELLPAGWYTVISYGSGPTYANPMQNVNQDGLYGSSTGQKDQFTITVTVCASPKYNRPYKASVDASKQPHLIEWKERVGSTPAYPRTDTTYTLPTENFNCIDDTPFTFIACDTIVKKVAYYVFKTTKETYVEINTFNQWGIVYAFDVRTDSALLATATPIQPCVKGNSKIQLCRLPAGTYTLVILAGSSAVCSSVSPKIYVDQVRESRFDHAKKAYDFSIVPSDSSWHRGKVGEVNPQNPGRAGSSDFFSCTTGTQPTDPTNAKCTSDDIYNMYDPSKLYMYQGDIGNAPEIVRRNLWYTFVVDRPGRVYVKVENKTPTKFPPYRFAAYSSDVNGNLSFVDVVNSGQVDSSMMQGLKLIGHNGTPNYCNAYDEGINFYRDPCTQFEPQRYYILVENRNPYGYYNYDVMNPNNQLEVAIMIDSASLVLPKYDHYYKAYDFGSVGVGKHTGGTDNFSCATRNTKDPISGYAACNKTLWYKFTSTVTGNVRYRIKVNGVVKYTISDIRLFQEVKAGDSTSAGLIYQAGDTYRDTDNTYWTQHCISPGTWYLLLPGCNQVNEYVFPEIELVEQEGDFCSRPMVVAMSGAGTTSSKTIINCHTIGTDYGEFNPTLTCPVNGATNKYKSSWFRLDISGKDTLDVTTYVSENTNVLPADIKYRMMTGNCDAMQEQSCVLDAQTQNTYKCLTVGSYYFQVFVPVNTTPTGSTQVTGDIQLQLSSIKHADTCAPASNCLANANFIPQFDCNTDSAVRFVNFATYGASIRYQWDFGYGGETSNEVSPTFNYPQLATAQTYNATLRVLNTVCDGKDSVTIPITIPARPKFTLGADTSLCKGGTITLNATSYPGSTYRWSTGATTSTISTSGSGIRTYWAKVTYDGCSSSDTIKVYVNSITSRKQTKVLCNGPAQLTSDRNQQEEHNWSTGETTSSIEVTDPGEYYNTMVWNGCTITDTFYVIGPRLPFGADTAVCLKQPYKLNAFADGATSYLWHNNSTASFFNANSPGTYWVEVNYNGCRIRDTIVLSETTPVIKNMNAAICSGEIYTLPSGKTVNTPGLYNDTIKYAAGCDSLITSVNISVRTVATSSISVSICADEMYKLPSGVMVNKPGIYNDTIRFATGCDSLVSTIHLSVRSLAMNKMKVSICSGQSYTLPSGKVLNASGIYADTLKYAAGCDSMINTVELLVGTVLRTTTNAAICTGQSFTLPSGKTVHASGIYTDTVKSIAGCDSLIAVVELKTNDAKRSAITAAICNGNIYRLPSGKTVSTPGFYTDTIRYAAGCDSLITSIKLSASTVTRNNINSLLCSGKTYILPSGKIVTIAGTYNDTLRYAAGCDSLITTIYLTARAVTTNHTRASICEGTFYTLPSGITVRHSGTYNDTLRYISGCDSLINSLTLQVKAASRVSLNRSICIGEFYTLPSGKIVTSSGTYTDSFTSQSGCDSIITTVLTVNAKPAVSIAKSNDINCNHPSATLTATGGSKYEWWPTQSLSLPAQSKTTATPATTTLYKVRVASSWGCVAEDSILVSVNADQGLFLLPSAFTPNGDGKNDCFGVKSWGSISELNFSIYHRNGQLLFHTSDPTNCWDGTFKGEKLEGGTYVYQASAKSSCGNVFRKGTVVLIR